VSVSGLDTIAKPVTSSIIIIKGAYLTSFPPKPQSLPALSFSIKAFVVQHSQHTRRLVPVWSMKTNAWIANVLLRLSVAGAVLSYWTLEINEIVYVLLLFTLCCVLYTIIHVIFYSLSAVFYIQSCDILFTLCCVLYTVMWYSIHSVLCLLIYVLASDGPCRGYECVRGSVCIVINGRPSCVCPTCTSDFKPVSNISINILYL